jgi:hypothetical protein
MTQAGVVTLGEKMIRARGGLSAVSPYFRYKLRRGFLF